MADSLDKFLSAPTSTKVAMLILLMGVIGAGWYSLYFTEVQAAMARESGRTGQLNKTYAEEKNIEEQLGMIRAKIERGKAEQEAMLEKLPEAAEIAALLQQIEGRRRGPHLRSLVGGAGRRRGRRDGVRPRGRLGGVERGRQLGDATGLPETASSAHELEVSMQQRGGLPLRS